MGVTLGDIEKRTGGDQTMVGRVQLTQQALMKGGINPHQTPMQVGLVLDHSGSMGDEYRDGLVQSAADRGLAFGATVDDDGAVQVVFFDSRAHEPIELSLANYSGWVNTHRPGRMGSTNLADAIHMSMRVAADQLNAPGILDLIGGSGKRHGLLGRNSSLKPVQAQMPAYMLVITDGVPDDPERAKAALIEASYAPIFYKFLFVSNDQSGKRFLQELDDMDGRLIDNADTVYFTDGMGHITDENFSEEVVRELASWLAEAKKVGLLV